MENNVIEKAEYLKETKNLIKQALQEQGADISDTDPFRAFASIISNLKISSGDDAIKIKTGEEIDNMTSEDTLICICSKEYSYIDYDGVLVEYKRGVIYEVINGSANKLLFDTDTTNYRDLGNKPSINGVELINNKSLTELGIQPKGDYALKKDLPRNTSELNNDAGYLTEYTETDPTVPDYVKNITQEEIEKWNTPFEELDPTIPQHVKDITEDDIDKWNASEDYKNLKNKPLINGVELNENKSLEDLGIQPKGEYITEETDPTVPDYVKNITQEDIDKWNSGGDVNVEETDPTVPSHVKSITQEDIDKWNSGGIAEETDPTVPEHVKAITEEDIAKWNSGGDINIDDATRRVWSYSPAFKTDPTPNMWSLISNTVYTDKIPKGKYLILYRATVGAGDYSGSTGISTITGGLDGVRLDNTTRNSVPLVNGLLSTGQALYYAEFTEEKTHTLDVYSYANITVGIGGVIIDVIRIGDVAGGEGLTVLPIASKDDLGAIKAGDYLKVDEDGTLHVTLDGSDGTIITTNNNSRLRDGKYNVIAVNHRGYSTVAPENTLPAYIMSKEKGFNYAECDVSFTSDGVAVLLHDATIDRTSDGSGSVSNMTYEQLLQYDFGSWKSDEYTGTKIPTFEEFITLCKNIGLHPYIELKSNGNYTQEQIVEIVNMVKKNGMKGNVTYISFNKTYLEYIKQADRQARLGYLISNITQEIVEDTLSLRSGINEVYLGANYSNLTDDKVNTSISYNIPLEIWTVNDENIIKNMNSYISGVTSDSLIAGQILSGISDTTISEETDPTVPQHVKDITEEDIARWNSGIGSGSSVNVDALPIGSVLLYNGDEIPEGYIELEDYEPTYSIEEKVIGTWIDGRPIYRKVIVTTTPSTENSWVDVAIGVDNIKEYIRYDAKFETSGLTYFADIFEDSTHKFMAVAKSNAIAMLVGSSGWCSKPVTLILEYTKTTD